MGRQERLVTIMLPVFNDWESLSVLLDRIDEVLIKSEERVKILVVDDGSDQGAPPFLFSKRFQNIDCAELLMLRSNIGHQRAIAVGLAFIEDKYPNATVIIMDADGEDRPEDIAALLTADKNAEGKSVIFAERGTRQESATFKILYRCYRLCFRFLTGRAIKFGNFSLIPPAHLARVSGTSEIWNNYAAALMKSRAPVTTVSCNRGARLVGNSQMNLLGLVVHGLSAMSVYSEIIGVRALAATAIMFVASLSLGLAATIIRLTTDLAIPGWATYAVGLSFVALLQSATLSAFFVFLILHGRDVIHFIPARDYKYFVREFRSFTD